MQRLGLNRYGFVGALGVVVAAGFLLHRSLGSAGRPVQYLPWGTTTGTSQEEWAIAETPSVRIGEEVGQSLYRVVGAVKLVRGLIVVANAGTNELRGYRTNGTLESVVGRRGRGPGEFEDLSWLQHGAGDTLHAFDRSVRRITIIDPDLRYISSVALSSSADVAFPSPVGVLRDGSILATASPAGPAPTDPREGIVQPDEYLVLYEPDGQRLRILTAIKATNPMFHLRDGPRVIAAPLLFAGGTTFAIGPNAFYVGEGGEFPITRYDATSGDVRSVVEHNSAPQRVTSADVKAAVDDAMQSREARGGEALLHRLFDAMPVPEHFPAYGEVIADEGSNLWVRSYPRPTDDIMTWRVFDTSGRVIDLVVEVPRRFQVTHIGHDFILGVWVDRLGVESVRLYELTKR